jgi:hypothetical protein
MSNNKQSSVEYLATQILDNWNDIQAGARNIDEFIEKAKLLRKAEILDAYQNGMADGYYFEGSRSDWESEGNTKYFAEKYYNETFGGNK